MDPAERKRLLVTTDMDKAKIFNTSLPQSLLIRFRNPRLQKSEGKFWSKADNQGGRGPG